MLRLLCFLVLASATLLVIAKESPLVEEVIGKDGLPSSNIWESAWKWIPQTHPVSVATPPTSSTLNPNKILCPVLAALYNAGLLKTDSEGSVTADEFYRSLLQETWDDSGNAYFQATGIADYDKDQKEIQQHRDRCLPLTPCWFKKRINGGNSTAETTRWLNIFKMNGFQTVEHGISTGVRGGANNVPEFDHENGPCNGTYPCESRFQKFYVSCAEEDTGRFYLKNILCVICNAYLHGDKSGEFAYNPFDGARKWQMTAAIIGWLRAFGRLDEEENGPYFEMEDARAMIMKGVLPDGWKKRKWGSLKDFPDAAAMELPCENARGFLGPWWTNSTCPSATGQKCNYIKPCTGGAFCIASGDCVCGRGSNGVGMCAKNGKCVERESTCTYFGEKCVSTPADNPKAPW